ncbi:MAG: hypothetical protein SchgKO_23670 [Schleiferiaceae bacterium]
MLSSCSLDESIDSTFDKPQTTLYILSDRDTLSWNSFNTYQNQLSVYDRKRGCLGEHAFSHKSAQPLEDTLFLTTTQVPPHRASVGKTEGGHWQVTQRTWRYEAIATAPKELSLDSSINNQKTYIEPRRREDLFEDYLYIEHKSARQGKINDSTFIVGIFPKYRGKALSEEWIDHKMERFPIALIQSDSTIVPIINPDVFTFNPFAENPIFTANSQFVYASYAHHPELIRYDLAEGTYQVISPGSGFLPGSEISVPTVILDSIHENSYRNAYYQKSKIALCLHTSEEFPLQWIRLVKDAQEPRDEQGLINPPNTAAFFIEISNREGTEIHKILRLDGAHYVALQSFYKPPFLYVFNRQKSTPHCGAFDGFRVD